MADVTKNIVIQVDAKGATVTVNGIAKSFDTLTRAVKFAKDEMKEVNTNLEQIRSASGLAGAATLEFSRVIQDSNYGIQGVANNISQLSNLLVSLTITAGGVANAWKAMVTALSGPLGLVIAISTAIAGLERYSKNAKESKENTSEFSIEVALLNKELQKLSELTKGEVLKNLEEYNKVMREGTILQQQLFLQKLREGSDDQRAAAMEKVLGMYTKEIDLQNRLKDLRSQEVPDVREIINIRKELLSIENNRLSVQLENEEDFAKQVRIKINLYKNEQESLRVLAEEEKRYADILKNRPKDLQKVGDLVSSGIKDLTDTQIGFIDTQINKEAELTLRTEEEIRRRYQAYQQMFSSLSQLNADFASLAEVNAEIELQNAIKRGEDEEAARLRIEKKKQAALVKAAKFQAALDAAMLGAQIARDFAQGLVSLQVGSANTAKIGFPQNIPFLVAYAAQAASIIISMKRAKKQAEAAIGAIGGGSEDSGSTGNIVQPSFNIVGASGTNQLADTIRSQTDRPVKAYVVSKDVRSASELERNIVDGSSIS